MKGVCAVLVCLLLSGCGDTVDAAAEEKRLLTNEIERLTKHNNELRKFLHKQASIINHKSAQVDSLIEAVEQMAVACPAMDDDPHSIEIPDDSLETQAENSI